MPRGRKTHPEAPQPISRDTLRRTAEIMGRSSASALTLMDADRREAAGETVEFYVAGGSVFVVKVDDQEQ